MVEIAQLKSLRKELKIFQKVSKNDSEKGKEKAKEILNKLKLLLKDKDIKNNSDNVDTLNKSKEMLNLYLTNIEAIDKINKKWTSKK
ncbi:MAG: hypothetical protein ACTSRG_22635 [Candidatus Helarchaeota archaeon]